VTDAEPLTATGPSLARAGDLVETAIDRELFVTLFGSCRVEYEGRAASTLDTGDRLVVCKPDGTVLVHTDEGQQPVNWQPPGCSQEIAAGDERLVLRSHRTTPEEELLVAFDRVVHVAAFDATDPTEIALTGTEADLRDRLLGEPSLLEQGFEPRATERQTAAGAVDVYGVDADGNDVVVELKRRRAGPDAVSQLNRYVESLSRELHAESTVRGILVAPSVTDRAGQLLERRGLEFVALSPDHDGSVDQPDRQN
jgi:RecB family endonuclease NucS